jgi:hypothetical protein
VKIHASLKFLAIGLFAASILAACGGVSAFQSPPPTPTPTAAATATPFSTPTPPTPTPPPPTPTPPPPTPTPPPTPNPLQVVSSTGQVCPCYIHISRTYSRLLMHFTASEPGYTGAINTSIVQSSGGLQVSPSSGIGPTFAFTVIKSLGFNIGGIVIVKDANGNQTAIFYN